MAPLVQSELMGNAVQPRASCLRRASGLPPTSAAISAHSCCSARRSANRSSSADSLRRTSWSRSLQSAWQLGPGPRTVAADNASSESAGGNSRRATYETRARLASLLRAITANRRSSWAGRSISYWPVAARRKKLAMTDWQTSIESRMRRRRGSRSSRRTTTGRPARSGGRGPVRRPRLRRGRGG